MPRGVYDRSKISKKSDEKPAAPKAAKTPKAVKAKGQNKAQRALQSAQSDVAQEVKKFVSEEGPGLAQLAQGGVARGLLDTFDLSRTTDILLHIRNVVGSGTAINSNIVESIDTALEKIVKKLDSSLTEAEEKAEPAEVVEQKEVVQVAPAPVLAPAPVIAPVAQPVPTFAPAPVAAPIPFNPPPASVQ